MNEVAAALQQGRAPRAGRGLQEAARVLSREGELAGAARAFRLAALLELRRGKAEQALRPARAAERLVRDAQAREEHGWTLDLLSRIYSHHGESSQAIRIAERWVDRAPVGQEAAARRRLALAKWTAGDVNGALALLEDPSADPDSQARGGDDTLSLLYSQMLVRVGCPAAAQALLIRKLKQPLAATAEVQAHLARGWAGLCLATPDQALRSLRRAARLAISLESPPLEVEIATALAHGELARARVRGADTARAEARLQRRLAQATRMGLLHLTGSTAPPMGALAAATAKEAAQALVALVRAGECLALVDACCIEVERLSTLPPGTPPYGFTQVPPLSLE